MNAYATPVDRLNGADGTILFGKQFLAELLGRPEAPDAAVLAVCAHEFGHILQYKHRLDDILRPAHPTVKLVELQADFFAGYFAGIRKRERPSFPAVVFAATQYDMGDFQFGNVSHHGTPDERAAAIEIGFITAYLDNEALTEAMDISTEYVLGLQ